LSQPGAAPAKRTAPQYRRFSRCEARINAKRRMDAMDLSGRNPRIQIFLAVAAWLSIVCAAPLCRGARIVFIEASGKGPNEQLAIAGQFYGIDVVAIQIHSQDEARMSMSALRENDTLGIVVTPDALELLPKQALLASLRRQQTGAVPLLITGITAQTDLRRIASFSRVVPASCETVLNEATTGAYIVGGPSRITKELANQEIPGVDLPVCTLATDAGSDLESLLAVRIGQAKKAFYVRYHFGTQEIFLLSATNSGGLTKAGNYPSTVQQFSRVAPIMLFVRYAAGKRAWHSVGHYANLTIDDAWLHEPYGYLDYHALLRQMDAFNFHTTIAFIPWNYDRSDPELVRLFRSRPDRFSICIHGNNHDHLEFGGYDRTPLNAQEDNIHQALARMDEFNRLTELAVDRVMIFPDEIAPPIPTLRALEGSGFEAAANADLVPLGSLRPPDPLFNLKAANADFTSFPLIRRHSAEVEVSKAQIAIDAFLENPLLFYAHHGIFSNGIQGFNSIAATVNRTQPDVHWTNLGSIVKHFYKERVRGDGNYDILAYSSNFILENKTNRHLVYYVEKPAHAMSSVQSVEVNGRPRPYELSGDTLRLTVQLDPGESTEVGIRYRGGAAPGTVDISKKGLKIMLLRRVSDFRDITMSRSQLGRAVTSIYYHRHLDDMELTLERYLPVLGVLFALLVIAGCLLANKSGKANFARHQARS